MHGISPVDWALTLRRKAPVSSMTFMPLLYQWAHLSHRHHCFNLQGLQLGRGMIDLSWPCLGIPPFHTTRLTFSCTLIKTKMFSSIGSIKFRLHAAFQRPIWEHLYHLFCLQTSYLSLQSLSYIWNHPALHRLTTPLYFRIKFSA